VEKYLISLTIMSSR